MKKISVLVHMLTNYLYEQGFSALVKIKSKKRNSIMDDDLENQLPVLQFRYYRHYHTLFFKDDHLKLAKRHLQRKHHLSLTLLQHKICA